MPLTDEECVTGAYQIRNLINGKLYVGGAYKSFVTRWNNHRSALRRGKHVNQHLQAAWRKYGEANFTFEVLEKCQPIKKVITACEQKWLDLRSTSNREYGYNHSPTAGSSLGIKRSEETRGRISDSHHGKRQPRSNETKEKISRANIGKRRTDEAKARMSEKQLEIAQRKRDAASMPVITLIPPVSQKVVF